MSRKYKYIDIIAVFVCVLLLPLIVSAQDGTVTFAKGCEVPDNFYGTYRTF